MSLSVLIVTLPPLTGGVPAKAHILASHLRSRGHRVTVSHYATLRDYPDLVVPSWRALSGRRPQARHGQCFGDFPCVAVGCRFPELEFTYYRMTPRWRDLIDKHDRHIAVGGTVLVSYPLAIAGVPHLVWCASTMIDDRIDRRRSMPWVRKFFDRLVIGPVQRAMEEAILKGAARFLAVSSHALESLVAAGGATARFSRVPIPVDLDRFTPPRAPPRPGVIGFAGRTSDPRKNLPLLIAAVKHLRDRGDDVVLRLTGDPPPALQGLVRRCGIADHVTWAGWLAPDGLARFLRELDVFVIPSSHEGLNLAGLEAMACSVPVVSTRCGGPQDYVVDGETGALVASEPAAMADAIDAIVGARETRDRMGRNARALVERNFSHGRFESALADAWQQTWGDRP